MILEYKNVINLVVLTVSVLCVVCCVFRSAGDGGRRRHRGLSRTDRRTLERLKPPTFLNLFFFFFFFFVLILYFILYVCYVFCSVSNHLDQKRLYQGFHV